MGDSELTRERYIELLEKEKKLDRTKKILDEEIEKISRFHSRYYINLRTELTEIKKRIEGDE